MTTIRELIEKLQEFPPEAEILIEDIESDQQFFIMSFSQEFGRLLIGIGSEQEPEPEEEEPK
ncbi:hypothetical protein [Nostoc sp. WHI]|uniref:hypothetical protein n=1 Tax=Nostoc sp. WHI TaxID=2650611 RepID=UPI0018C536A3|nr:hypothetical protein [Nostoc sp. WHI]MBG1267760.1 hypothetical protein [Nostoc sp. WHI]